MIAPARRQPTEAFMETTHPRPLLRRAAALAAVPAMLLGLAACGDDDDDSASADDFCDQANEIDQEFAAVDDPSSDDFSEALDALREMDPPEEIADDWDQLVEAMESLEDVDVDDPDALAEFDAEELQAASDRIDTFMEEECGL
jgi:hypothetical protein